MPVLELDDGSYLTESLVMEYLEEIYLEPVMIGKTPLACARTREIERFIDTAIAARINSIFYNTNQIFQDRLQVPEVVEQANHLLEIAFNYLNTLISENTFVAGEHPSIADCTLIAALKHGKNIDIHYIDKYTNIMR